MQYGQLITRSLSIAWAHKYLWLLAILGGADVTVSSFGFNFNTPSNFGRGAAPGSAPDVSQFFATYGPLLAAIGLVVLVVAVAFFLLSCVTTGALVRAAAEHDAERPFGLGIAWRAGVGTFGRILGLRLIGLLLALALVVIFGGLVLLGLASYFGDRPQAVGAIVGLGVLLALVVALLAIPIGLVFILATRAIVLEQRGAVDALRRGMQLFWSRLGRVLLVWLLQVGIGIAIEIALAIALIPLLLLSVGAVVLAAVRGGAAAALVLGIPLGLLSLAVAVVLSGLVGTYLSTYWTLAFRRMEVDLPPAPVRQAPYPPYPPRPTT